MSNPSPTEVERAFQRPDIEELKRVVAEHFDFNLAQDGGRNVTDLSLDPIIFVRDDHERSLALVAVAMASYDDRSYLGLVSASILEDIFFMENEVPDTLLERIEVEALRNPRFRWMLSGVWTSSFRPECRDLIERLTTGVSFDDPMPPMEGT